MSGRRPKPPPPPSEMHHFLRQNRKTDLLFLGLGLTGAIGVVLYGYFSSQQRRKFFEEKQLSPPILDPLEDESDDLS